jgi:cytoskeletal protein CcmA (bactofilin family)
MTRIEKGTDGMWNRDVSAYDREPGTPPEPPAADRVTEERRRVAWVGKSVVFRGDLISLEDMTIDGRVEGMIEIREHHLTVGPEAHIEADVVAKTVTVFGQLTGTIVASGNVTIRETASVEGDITCPRVAIADRAVVRGRIDTGGKTGDKRPKAEPSATSRDKMAGVEGTPGKA